MKKEVRNTVFFRLGSNLAVFAMNAVDVRVQEALGFPVELEELLVDRSAMLDDGIKRHFWVVTTYPKDLVARLTVYNHAALGTSRYRVSSPKDGAALKLLRLAEDKARAALFVEETAVAV